MKIELAPLPYDYTALEPKISKSTLEVCFSLVSKAGSTATYSYHSYLNVS